MAAAHLANTRNLNRTGLNDTIFYFYKLYWTKMYKYDIQKLFAQTKVLYTKKKTAKDAFDHSEKKYHKSVSLRGE